jgi:hypothetical protein
MDFEQGLKDEISSISGLSGKVFPTHATEGTKTPYVVYHKFNRSLIKTLDGFTGFSESNYGIMVFSEQYAQLQTLYKAIRDKLISFEKRSIGSFVQGVSITDIDEGYDEEAKLYRMDIIIKIYFEE